MPRHDDHPEQPEPSTPTWIPESALGRVPAPDRETTDASTAAPDADLELDAEPEPSADVLAELDGLFADWRQAVTRPVRVDASLAALLEHGRDHATITTEVAADATADRYEGDDLIARSNVIDLDAARNRRGRIRRAAVRGGAIGITAITVSSGLAAAGVLPSPVRRAVTGAAHVVGVDIDPPARPSLVDPTSTEPETTVPFEPPAAEQPPAIAAPTSPETDGPTSPRTSGTGTRPTSTTDGPRPDPTTTVDPTRSVDDGACTGDECPPPPCRTVDPKTGEPIPPWKQRRRCRPCPTTTTTTTNGTTSTTSPSGGRTGRCKAQARSVDDGKDADAPRTTGEGRRFSRGDERDRGGATRVERRHDRRRDGSDERRVERRTRGRDLPRYTNGEHRARREARLEARRRARARARAAASR